jgi:hypothetical protein
MNTWSPAVAAVALLVAAVLQAGCVSSTVQEIREADTGLDDGDVIAIMGRRSLPSRDETEHAFVSCVSRNVSSGSSRVAVIDENTLRDALFPWFEPRTAPANAGDLTDLVSLPILSERLEQLGLRYLVWIDGDTDRTDAGGSLTCSVTAAGAGCFGFLTWENDSSYEASVWDIRNGTSAGRISSEAVGTSYMPAVIVPLPFIARVRANACSRLADQLKTFLAADG